VGFEKVVEELNRALAEELEGLLEKVAGTVDMQSLLRQFVPALQRLLGGMPCGPSPYQVLGLDPSAPDEVVKLGYRHLAQRRHPDRGGSQEVMARLNQAYEEIGKMKGWK